MRSCYNQHAAHSLLECPTCRALVRREAVLLALRFRNGCERAPEGNYITSRNRICAPWVENVDHSLMNRLLAREAWDRVLAPLGLRALLQALNSKNPSLVVALPNIPFYTGALERTRYSDSPGLLDPVEERNQRVFRGGARPRHLCIVR